MPRDPEKYRAYKRATMRERRGRERANKSVTKDELAVLELAKAGCTMNEIAEALDFSEEAVVRHLGRVAEYLAPTPASELTVNTAKCLPFFEEIWDDEQ